MMEYDGYKHAHLDWYHLQKSQNAPAKYAKDACCEMCALRWRGRDRWKRLIRFRDYDICQNVIIPDEKLFRGTKVDTLATQISLQRLSKYLDAFKSKAYTVLLNAA